MYNNKLTLLIGLAAVLMFSAAKREPAEADYAAQLKSLDQMTMVGGEKLDRDSLSGKMVVLNFWASYNPASRINNFRLLALQQKFSGAKFYQAEGLKVVSVSLDTYRSPLLKAIETDGTKDFCHLCDFQGTGSELCKMFDVNQPVNLLVDPNGKILARDFAVGTIEHTLEMLTDEGDFARSF